MKLYEAMYLIMTQNKVAIRNITKFTYTIEYSKETFRCVHVNNDTGHESPTVYLPLDGWEVVK